MSGEIDKQRSTNFGAASPFLKLTQVRPEEQIVATSLGREHV
jgi:hypothetical protein